MKATRAGRFWSKALKDSSTGEAALAQEALEHVNHQEEKQLERLDRNRAVSKRLSYRVVGLGDLEKVQKLLYASYYPEEPITKHLGLCKGINSIPDEDRIVNNILSKYLSVMAEDSLTGEPVGVAVNNSCRSSDSDPDYIKEEMAGVVDSSYRPLIAIHHQLRMNNAEVFAELGTNTLFSMQRVGVSIKGMGIATDLIRRSVLLAGSLGYQGIKAEPTSNFARRTFRLVGLQPTNSILYSDFTFEGKNVLEGIPEWEISFHKKKFFQSALKHII